MILKNGLELDDYTKNTDPELTGYWTQLCKRHAKNINTKQLDTVGSGTCGVKGCWTEAEHYFDFNKEDICQK